MSEVIDDTRSGWWMNDLALDHMMIGKTDSFSVAFPTFVGLKVPARTELESWDRNRLK